MMKMLGSISVNIKSAHIPNHRLSSCCDMVQLQEYPRARARITFPVWVLRHLSGKARGLRILLVWKGRATPPGGMDRRPNRGRYSCANPKVTTTFCISPCTPISYTAFLCPTPVSWFNLKKCEGKVECIKNMVGRTGLETNGPLMRFMLDLLRTSGIVVGSTLHRLPFWSQVG